MENQQVVVVTGASSGIGRAIALAFGADGARVVVNYVRSRAAAEAVAVQIRRGAGEALVVQADVSDPAAVEALVAQTLEAYGQVDVWVNNAGADILTHEAAEETELERLRMVLDVDVTGTFLCCRAIAPVMQARGSGLILNMAWDHVVHGMAGIEAELYAIAKGAIWSYSKCLARSLAPAVRVNTLAPGWVRTRYGDEVSEATRTRIAMSTPLKRWGMPDDLAGVAVFLSSPAAAFITGQTIAVNGGMVMI